MTDDSQDAPRGRSTKNCFGVMCRKRYSLVPLMVISVFTGSSCWFATNAVIKDIAISIDLGSKTDVDMVLGYSTVIIQLGFIMGTFLIAFTALADRLSPKHIFFVACTLASISNAMVALVNSLPQLLALRFFTGICLAGVYPVAMKIASSWYSAGLGAALGFILAALCFGTALPSLLDVIGNVLPWRQLLMVVSCLVFFGGLIVELFVGIGPHHKTAPKFDPGAVVHLFRNRLFRSNAIGYFGHNWEIYTYWAFIPDMIKAWALRAGARHYGSEDAALDGVNISLATFIFISIGIPSCISGALLVRRVGCAPLAFGNLCGSCFCCITSPLIFHFAPWPLFVCFMLLWGFCVVGDSPMFSAIAAQHAPQDIVASAMTIVVCIGFTCTVISLQLMTFMLRSVDHGVVFALFITPGPLIGLFNFWPLLADGRQRMQALRRQSLQEALDPAARSPVWRHRDTEISIPPMDRSESTEQLTETQTS